MISDQDVRALGVARWTAPLLVALRARDGARFVELLSALGISRDSLVRTLAHATAAGWVMRNPGHGHPLRPDYVLTARGQEVAAACARLEGARASIGLAPEELSRWSLPVAFGLRGGWTRFSVLQAGLAPVTPRALSLTLKQMVGVSLVARRLEDGAPPSALYGLAPDGAALVASLVAT